MISVLVVSLAVSIGLCTVLGTAVLAVLPTESSSHPPELRDPLENASDFARRHADRALEFQISCENRAAG